MHFKDFDIFPKIHKDYNRRTATSGIITIACLCTMAFLLLTQMASYLFKPQRQFVAPLEVPIPSDANGYVDFKRLPKLSVYFDFILDHVPCQFVEVSVLDSLKDVQNEAVSHIKRHRYLGKQRIQNKHAENKFEGCGSCFGLRSGCCNTCKEVKRAFKEKGRIPPSVASIPQCKSEMEALEQIKGESCHVFGTSNVPFFKGTILLTAVYDENELGGDMNFSHTLQSISVSRGGNDKSPVLVNTRSLQREQGKFKVRYFINSHHIVENGNLRVQTSASSYERYRGDKSTKKPGIYIHYEFTPLFMKEIREKKFLRFVVNLMAILGGVFSLGQLLDHLLSRIPRSKSGRIVQ